MYAIRSYYDEYIDKYGLEEDIELIRAKYKKRRDVMYSSIKKYMSPEVKSTYPKGGMFLWLKAPEYINSRDLLERCLENKVAFVPGGAFFVITSYSIHYTKLYEDS